MKHDDDTGFYQAPNSLVKQYGKIIGPYGIAVYSALLAYDYGNDQCYPSQQRIADEINCALGTVNRTIAKLVDAKLVEVVHRKGDKGQTSNLYRPLLKVAATQQPKPKKGKPTAGPVKQQFETKTATDTYALDWGL